MKKVILKQSGSELGHAIVEDDKASEMEAIYLDNYKGEEYSVEIVDVTDQVNQEKVNEESLKYLADTDWYIIREVDSGVQCPVEVKQARNEARARIVK
jgi:hypothetical protein